MVLAFDLDDVLADYTAQLCRFHNDRYGTDLAPGDVHSPKYWEVWGTTEQEAVDRVAAFVESRYFDRIEPVSGAQDAISDLGADHDLAIITARSRQLADRTRDWLEEHYPGRFDAVHFADKYTEGIRSQEYYARTGDHRLKSHYCRTLDVDLLVDDSVENARYCAEHVPVLLFDRPWVPDEADLPGVHRVGRDGDHWAEVLAFAGTV